MHPIYTIQYTGGILPEQSCIALSKAESFSHLRVVVARAPPEYIQTPDSRLSMKIRHDCSGVAIYCIVYILCTVHY